MREPKMKWFFTPSAETDSSPRQDDDNAPGLISLPAELLHRHGARVLDPGKAALLSGDQPPRPTVYRARTLLIPDDVIQNDDLIDAAGEILGKIGLELELPRGDLGFGRGDREIFDVLRQLPRPVVLAPLQGFPTPVEVDAWVALQTLRARAVDQDRPEGFREAVERISLEHLLVGSAITGSPVGGWGGGIAGGPGTSSGGAGPGSTDSYLFSGGDPRTPVAVLVDPPARQSDGAIVSEYGRRPVVAVVDTGVRAHPWLDVAPNGAGGYTMPAGSFVTVDDAIQDAIRAEGEAVNGSDGSRQVIWAAWDKPMTANPLIGECNPALGHSTFIAGIVRQVAPDARVLAIRVMHSDDVANEGDIICALGQLAARIALAEQGDLAGMVDVVSLSFGYFSESGYDQTMTSGLWTAIEALLSLGVVVVAAAGNFATRREYYPAAFALHPVPDGQVPVISVGALNPNGTKAMFSNDGHWVKAWAQGACVVSTYPVDVDGRRAPELRAPVNRRPAGVLPPGREALDPDDFTAGWAIWSGTSFSAPYLAALITRALLSGAAAGSGLRLDNPGQQAAANRALAAVEMLREEEEQLRQEETRRPADRDE
jgi:hypothetical protein